MAGHYFYDPRPFYGVNMSHNLMPLDELFYGKYEPVPYWMDQRMGAIPFGDYYNGHKHMVSRGPDMQQFIQREYKRPEVRDDIYTDMYKRADQFHGYGAYPDTRQLRSQDDTWVHAMSPHQFGGRAMDPQQGMTMFPQPRLGNEQYRPMVAPMMAHMSNNGGDQYMRQMEAPVSQMNSNTSRNVSNNGGEQYRQMEAPMMGHKSNKSMGGSNHSNGNGNDYGINGKNGNNGNNGNNGGNGNNGNNGGNGYKQVKVASNGHSGYEQVKSQGQGGKNANGMATKHTTSKQQRYTNDDSSSDDDEDEYQNGSNGGKWVTTNSSKHGSGHNSYSQSAETGSHNKKSGSQMSGKKSSGQGNQSYGSNMVVYDSGKKQSGHKHGSQSKTTKMLYQNDGDSSSDDDDESYGYSKMSSKGQSLHGSANTKHSHGGKEKPKGGMELQSYGQQPKHTQFKSQSNYVELKVPICCDNCERKVRACLEYMDGVENVLCDQWQRKVIVYGNVKADAILKRVKRVKKASELWQQAAKRFY